MNQANKESMNFYCRFYMRLLLIISHMKFKQIHLKDHNELLGQFEINQKT